MALSYFYNHRYSKDIDIFIHDSQYLNFLTPRLNNFLENLFSENYVEGPVFVKLKNPDDSEIDYIITRNLSGVLPQKKNVYGLIIPVESPIEITCQKIYYKGLNLKVRDVIDIAIIYKKRTSLNKYTVREEIAT